MDFIRGFIRKLLIFDVIFGARTKKLTGINDKDNVITTDVVIDSADNSITFTNNDLPKFLKEDVYFRVFTGPNNNELFRVKSIDLNKVFVYETVQDDTNTRTIDARLWQVHNDNSISRKSPTGGTMFNVDNMNDTGVECDGSGIAKAYTSHYHSPEPRKTNVEPIGEKNNQNLIFTLPNGEKYVSGTLEVYLSHLHLDSDQFVENAEKTGFTIVLDPQDRWKLNCPPLQGESLTINYLQDVE